MVAAFYGLRRGEVVGLKWDAIDFERGTITIKHTVTSVQMDGKTKMYAQDSAKTKSSMRTLPLVGSFAEYFKEVKAAQEINKKVCGNCYNYEYDGYVFVDELGNLIALLRRSAGRSIAGRVKLPLPIIRSKYRRSQPASESCGGRLPPVLTLRWTARWCRIRCKGRRIGGKTRPVKEYIAAPIDFSFFLI